MLKKKKKNYRSTFYFPSPKNTPYLKYSSSEGKLALRLINLWYFWPNKVLFLGSRRLASQFDWFGVSLECVFKLIKMKCLWFTVCLQWLSCSSSYLSMATYSDVMQLFHVAGRLRNGGVISAVFCFIFHLWFI